MILFRFPTFIDFTGKVNNRQNYCLSPYSRKKEPVKEPTCFKLLFLNLLSSHTIRSFLGVPEIDLDMCVLELLEQSTTNWYFTGTKIYSFTDLEARSPKSRCWQDCIPSERMEERGNENLLMSLLASGNCYHPWCSLACNSFLCLYLHVTDFPLCMLVSTFLSYKDTNHWFKAYLVGMTSF